MKKDLIMLILLFYCLQLLLIALFPNTVYAMSPEDCIESTNYNIMNESQKYWITHPFDCDAYALNQRNICLHNNTCVAEPSKYPFGSDSSSYSESLSCSINYKSKVILLWKQLTYKFNCFR